MTLFRRARPLTVPLELHRHRVQLAQDATEHVVRAHTLERAVRRLRGRADALRLDATREATPTDRRPFLRALADELDDADASLED